MSGIKVPHLQSKSISRRMGAGCVKLSNQVVEVITEETLKAENQKQDLNLMNIDIDKLDEIPTRGEITKCRVFKVYDGDSCSVIADWNGRPFKTSIRILDVDCPEMRPKITDDSTESKELKELEKAAACVCRDYVAGRILERLVQIKLEKHDKYGGRILARIYVNDHDNNELVELSSELIRLGFARPYAGEKKIPWTREELTAFPFVK